MILTALALVGAACGEREVAPPPPPPPPLALPPIDRTWTIADVREASCAMQEACKDEPLQLPTYGTVTFARIISPELHYQVPAVPRALHIAELERLNGAWIGISNTYARCGRPTDALAAAIARVGEAMAPRLARRCDRRVAREPG